MANANIITDNKDRLLVAVDFVSHFMKKAKPHLTTIFHDPTLVDIAEDYRRNARIADSEHLKTLLDFIEESQAYLVRKDFEQYFNSDSTHKELLIGYAHKWKNAYCDVEVSIRSFAMYCGRIAAMACYFYDIGVMDAPDFAVELIACSFPEDPNLNWTYLDFAKEMNINMEERLKSFRNHPRREPTGIISSGTEESSSDSTRICESDSSSNDQIQLSEGCSVTQSSISSVTPSMEVESLTSEVSELRVPNLDHTNAITEQTGGCSSIAAVPVTRSSSVSPRKIVFPKTRSSHSESASFSGQHTKSFSSLGKRRSTGSDDCVSSYVGESAAENDNTAEEVFSPSDPKKFKIKGADETE